jgi:hypothetical protein
MPQDPRMLAAFSRASRQVSRDLQVHFARFVDLADPGFALEISL